MNVLIRVVALAALATATGCKPPLHLAYDFGRAYVETLKLQADRTRPSVVNESYQLYGIEGVSIKVNAELEASEKEEGDAEIVK